MLRDSQTSIAITDVHHEAMMKELTSKLNIPLVLLRDLQYSNKSGSTAIPTKYQVPTYPIDPQRGAMIIYTRLFQMSKLIHFENMGIVELQANQKE